jgi:hypothetical protein
MRQPTARLRASTLGDAIGIGWFLREVDGVGTVGHGGSANGQFAELLTVPERGFAVVALSNADPDGTDGSRLRLGSGSGPEIRRDDRGTVVGVDLAGVGTMVSGLAGGGGPVPVIHPATGAGDANERRTGSSAARCCRRAGQPAAGRRRRYSSHMPSPARVPALAPASPGSHQRAAASLAAGSTGWAAGWAGGGGTVGAVMPPLSTGGPFGVVGSGAGVVVGGVSLSGVRE